MLFDQIIRNIRLDEPTDEIESIAYIIMEHELGITRTDVMAARKIAEYSRQSLDKIIGRINSHEPIQYILGEADFFGRKFFVSPSVLIPRQETELMVSEILKLDLKASPAILDIGTGSGCIAITVALGIHKAGVVATDISKEALNVAAQNASTLKAHVRFLQHDILHDDIPGKYDVIVSNPPYISMEEKNTIKKNVLNYEPHLALFSEHDTLLFYKHIAAKSRIALNKNGIILVEINEHYSKETLAIFHATGFSTCAVVKDLQNKDRIIIAQ